MLILLNMSRSKDNQAMKLGQLIENNMRNIFLEKSYKDVVEKLFLDSFLKNQILAYLWINSLQFYTVYFYYTPSWGLSKCIETKLQNSCFYLIESFSDKSSLKLVSLPHFLPDLSRKKFLLLCSTSWPNFIVWLHYFVR